MSTNVSIALVIALVFVAGGYYIFMADNGAIKDEAAQMEKTTEQREMSDTMMDGAGVYTTYDESKLAMGEDGPVVLFFKASWCPTCRALENDIKARLNEIPADVTILEVNYDSATDLKQKYGVTVQHTLVMVDDKGSELKQWTNSPTLAALLSEI